MYCGDKLLGPGTWYLVPVPGRLLGLSTSVLYKTKATRHAINQSAQVFPLFPGFTKSKNDPCLFFGNGMVLVYVDDCIFFGKDAKAINEVIECL